jgi:ATP-dependent Lon protease
MPKRPLHEEKKVSETEDKRKRVRRRPSEDVIWVADPQVEERKMPEPPIKLTKSETNFFKTLTSDLQDDLIIKMEKFKLYNSNETDYPLRLRILSLPISEYVKSSVIKKISFLDEEGSDSFKLRNWVDAFLKIPFGKTIPLPVTIKSGKDECSKFLRDSRKYLDDAVYGMIPAKTQIMQVLAQWVTNPDSIGNVIALHGPAGVGKTSIAKLGLSRALRRPFQFFSLGGASDISNYVGHSFTYEGSTWGRIVDSLMQHKCSNPIMYFDELDKISGTPHGEEIASMLIHLTDRTQNSHFHDRYFAGIDIDLSQCLFVFSFNDINLVNPILRDRMQVVHCGGYSESEKQIILKDYVWPSLLKNLKFTDEELILNSDCCKFMVREFSSKEQGIRTLIRCAETIITRLNILKIADEETTKDYKFFIKIDYPLQLNEIIIKKLMTGIEYREHEPWKSMYT